jgi:TRAP-type transport system periplasmic protein
MPLARRAFLASTMASLAAPALRRAASADTAPFALKLHHSFSSVSSVHDRFLAPWARKIEAQSRGRIRIDIFPSMQLGGQPAQLFDQARDGMADIVWTLPSHTPGRFPKIELFELPFVPARRALVSSKAIQDYAAANLKDEFREIRPICFSCSDRGVIHAKRPVQTIEDIRGRRLYVQTRFGGEALRALGARAVAMPSAQLAVAIAQHVVDGCVDPWDVVPALKLSDLLKTHTDFAESSLSSTTFVLAMNKAAFERLPADLKTVIDGNSGQLAAGMAGAMWDIQAAAVADRVGESGESVTTLPPEAMVHWRKATEPVVETWLRQMKEHRIDGGKLLAGANALLEKYANEPEPQPPPQATSAPKVTVATPAPTTTSPSSAPAAAKPLLPTASAAPPAKLPPAVAPALPPVPKPTPAPALPTILNIPL